MKDKTESKMELSDVNKTNDVERNGKNEVKSKTGPVSCSERIAKIFNFFTVEPFLLCYVLPYVLLILAVQKLNMEKACRVDLNYTKEICARAVAGDVSDNTTIEALNAAQVMVADMTAWTQPLQSGIPAIVILFVGAWSDRTGNRKTLMLVPLVGEFVSAFGLILTTYYFEEWPLWVTGLIESLPTAFSGGWSIALMGSYSYIADVTTLESRTFRIGIVAVIVTLGVPIGSSISGLLTESVGYYGVFGIGMVMYALGFLQTLFRIHDVRNTKTEGTLREKFVEFFHPRNVWDTLSLIFLSRGKRLARVLLVVWAHIVIMGPVLGEGAVLFLYTLKKFNMDVVEYGLFSSYSVVMSIIGTTIAVTLFSKFLKMHDAFIGIVATACKVISSFVYAFAPTKEWFYFGPAFDFFGNSGVTAIRSLGTKIVSPEEVGKMCSLIGLVDAIVPVVYTPIYSKVYSKTLETFPGAFYVLGGLMTVPAFFIFIFLYHLHRKEQKDIVKNPNEKEMHAHENAVTSL